MTSFQRRTVIVTCIATAMLMLDIAVVNVAIPRIGRDLRSALTGLQWIVDAYTLILAACVLTAGSLADRFGRRLALRIGLGIFTLTSVVCATASNIATLDISRGVQGLGGAIMFATSLAVLADAFPDHGERNVAFAAYGATIGASFAVGPLLGGVLTTELGWRSIFFVNLPIGVLCLAGTIWLGESRDPHPRRADWVGQCVLTGGLFLLVLGLLRGNLAGWSSTAIVAELAAASALLIGFVVIEALRRDPMLPLGLFRNRSFTGAQLAAFAISSSFFAIFIYLTLYLQEILHFSPIRAGLVLMPSTVIIFVVSGLSAQLLNRVSHRAMLSAGLVLVAAGLASMTLAGVHSSWTTLLLGEILAGVGTGLFNPALSYVALSEVDESQLGLAAGVNDTFRQVGIALGVAVLGALVPARAALGQGSPAAYVHGLHTALIVSTVVSAVGAVLSMAFIGRGLPMSFGAQPAIVPLATEVD